MNIRKDVTTLNQNKKETSQTHSVGAECEKSPKDIYESIITNKNDNFKSLYKGAYEFRNGYLYHISENNSPIKICNFAPYITSEVKISDGEESNRYIKMSGILYNGDTLDEITVSSDEFSSLNWITRLWGFRCNIEPGYNKKELLRNAIQKTARRSEDKCIYTHTGWRKIKGEWFYLLPNCSKFSVQLDNKLSNYGFNTKEPLIKDVHSLDFIDLNFVPKGVAYCLIGFVFLTPLNEFFKQAGFEPKTVLGLFAKTSVRKSSIAALMLSHFGNFSPDSMPQSFGDTTNSIINIPYYLKDCLSVVDDFHPTSKSDEIVKNQSAQALMRAIGDRVGKGRLRADGTNLPSHPPRGNIMITGEQVPDITESGLARLVILWLNSNDVNREQISIFQHQAREGCFRKEMEEYINWIKKTYLGSEDRTHELVTHLQSSFEFEREDFIHWLENNSISCHGRIPEAFTWFYIGLSFYLSFLQQHYSLSDEIKEMHLCEALSQFHKLAAQQASIISKEKPTEIWWNKFKSLLDSNKIYLSDRNTAELKQNSTLVGYIDQDYVYLLTDPAYQTVKRLCEEQGENFPVTLDTLKIHLFDEGYIKDKNGRKTLSLRTKSGTIRCTYIFRSKLKSFYI